MTSVKPDATEAHLGLEDDVVEPVDTAGATGTTATQPAESAESAEPSAPREGMTPARLFHKVNAFFYNKITGLGIILAMALLSLFGVLLQQAPPLVLDDPDSYARWLETVRPRYGGWTNVLSTLGLFNVFGSIWFAIVSVMLAISIVACTVHRIPQLWQRATNPIVHAGEGFFSHATIGHDVQLDARPDDVFAAAADQLRSRRFRIVSDDKDPHGSFYADKFRWAPFGTAVAHTSFVIILLGVLVTSQFGFRIANFPITVGDTAQVGHDTGMSVRVDSFADTYYPDGRPSDYVADITLLENGTEVAQKEIRVNQPLRYDGVAFYQASFGVAAAMRIADSTGKVIFEGGVPLQYTTDSGANVFGKLVLDEQNLEVFVVGAASGRADSPIGPGQMQVDVYPADQELSIDSKLIDQGVPTQVAGLNVTFERERQYTGLMVARDHGAIFIWVGSALLCIGTFITMGLKHRRIWVRVTPSENGSRLRLASADRNDFIFSRTVDEVVEDIHMTTATSSAPQPASK